MKRIKATDLVVIGSGWSGLVMAKEIVTRTALHVTVMERGPARTLVQYGDGMDEINNRRVGLVQNPAEQTITHRHSINDRRSRTAIWLLSSRDRHRRHVGTLGRHLRSLPAREFCAGDPPAGKVRRCAYVS